MSVKPPSDQGELLSEERYALLSRDVRSSRCFMRTDLLRSPPSRGALLRDWYFPRQVCLDQLARVAVPPKSFFGE